MQPAAPAAGAAQVRVSRQVLDRRRILGAALELVDGEGLEALSMRKLGGLLGVEAMALYHYFPSKGVLVDGLVALVLARLSLPTVDSEGDWAAVVRQVAASFRALGAAHPHLFPLLATIGLDNPASLPPAEAVLAVLTQAGLPAREAFDAFLALKSYVVGYTLWSIGDRILAQRGDPATAVAIEVDQARFPLVAEIVRGRAERRLDSEFEAGLNLLIEGIQARLSTSAAAPTRAG
ncbi:MAG TPA: TetR/AcrR family transcriptional regulator [Chloroflexota bacterium]|jgi:AcrR family transcriptional regulator|nr:TetR/AcrR family transcriptional regulator [Chloroflexota bacterium]